jgi:hypothetical protein
MTQAFMFIPTELMKDMMLDANVEPWDPGAC